MSLLFVARNRNMAPFRAAVEKLDPNIDVEVWPGVNHPGQVQFAVAWRQPEHVFEQFPNLSVISSLGAGADHLIEDDTIPESVRIVRAFTPSLADQMSDYITLSVLNLFRETEQYLRQQKKAVWAPRPGFSKSEITVGIMGMGKLGRDAAQRLRMHGFSVAGWSKSGRPAEGIETFPEQELTPFLNRTNILVCLLPLTPETEEILELNLFKQLRQPAFLINVARGGHLVEEDLIYALDTDLIRHAVLDVFSEEPLPESHPFWGREKITITPHIASITDPEEVAALVVDNYKRLLSGMELLYEVDRKRGY